MSGTDAAGNSGSAEATLLVDTVLPQVIINTFAGDNSSTTLKWRWIKPRAGASPVRQRATRSLVSVGGKSYTATVGSDLTRA